jgi:hypothetical protein
MTDTKNPPHHQRADPAVISYQNLRRFIGYLALLLPFLTWAGYVVVSSQWRPLDSISEYYFTSSRSIFVGTLCMVGMFLYAYRGYNDLEDRTFNIAAVLCVLIALFSMNPEGLCSNDHRSDSFTDPCNDFMLPFNGHALLLHRSYFGAIHDLAAAALFIILGYVSYCLFTKTARHRDAHTTEKPTPQKNNRNKYYKAFGITIWASLAFYVVYDIVISRLVKDPQYASLSRFPMLFIIEAICLWCFGLSWLIKGEGISALND